MKLSTPVLLAGAAAALALAGMAAAAPPVSAALQPVGPMRPTGPVKMTPGAHKIMTKDVPITCVTSAATPGNTQITFKASPPITGNLRWSAWKSCAGDAGCYQGKTNEDHGSMENYTVPQPGGGPYLGDHVVRDTCSATMTVIGG